MKGRLSWLFLLAFIGANLLSILAVEEEADQETCVGMCVRLIGKAGKVGLYRCKNKDRKKRLTLQLANITQLDKDGNKVGKVVTSLNKQNYDFSRQSTKIKYQGVDTRRIKLSATHSSGASLSVEAYVACEAGNVTWGNETYNVEKGDMKLIYELENYPWCNGTNTSSCREGEKGKSLELGLKVVNREGKPPRQGESLGRNRTGGHFKCRSKLGKKCPKGYRLGDNGAEMVAASQVECDGDFRSMLEGYPKVARGEVVFRIPKCLGRARIDPAVTLGADYDEDDKSSHAALTQVNVLCIVAMVIALFTFM